MGLDIHMLPTDIPPAKYYAAYKQLRAKMVELSKQGIDPWTENVPEDVKELRNFCRSARDYSYEKYKNVLANGDFPYEFAYWRKDYNFVDALDEVWFDVVQKYGLENAGAYSEAVYYPAAVYIDLKDGSFQKLRNFDVWHNWNNDYIGLDYPKSKAEAFDRVAAALKEWRVAEKFLKASSDNYLIVVLSP